MDTQTAKETKDQETKDFAEGFEEEITEEPKEKESAKEDADPDQDKDETPEEQPQKKDEAAPVVDWQKEAERYRKEAEDNKSWATTVAQENAQLKAVKTVETKAEPKADDKKAQGDEPPEEIKAFYEDYPEMKAAVEFEAKRLIKEHLGNIDLGEIQGTVKNLNSNLAQERFNNTVLGGYYDDQGQYVNGHPDAFKVFKTPQYQTWFDEELKKNPKAGDISDPREAIKFIGRFKAEVAKRASQMDADENADLQTGAAASLTSGTGDMGHKPKKDKNDFKSGFEEEAKAA